MPRATKSRVARLRERIACPVCSHRLGDPVRVTDGSLQQVEEVVVLMGLMRKVLEPPDIFLQLLEATPAPQSRPAPRATKARASVRQAVTFCPACGYRFGDPVPHDDDDSSQPGDGALLVCLMACALERFDAALRDNTLPPGRPVPRALLPAGYVPPDGMVISESTPVIIDAPDEGMSVDDILEALQQGVSQQ